MAKKNMLAQSIKAYPLLYNCQDPLELISQIIQKLILSCLVLFFVCRIFSLIKQQKEGFCPTLSNVQVMVVNGLAN